MPTELFAPLLSTISTLVVAMIAYLAGRGMKTHEWRLAIQRDKLSNRMGLYSAFLAEVDRLTLLSINKTYQDPMGFNDIAKLLASIELMDDQPVIDAARGLFEAAMSSHMSDAKRVHRDQYQLKKQFIAAARAKITLLESDRT